MRNMIEPPRKRQRLLVRPRTSPILSDNIQRRRLLVRPRTPSILSVKIQKQKPEKNNNDEEEPKSLESYICCGICYEFKAEQDTFSSDACDHPFCTECITKHVAAKTNQNILKINCPNQNCNVSLTPESLRSILPHDVIFRWESALFESLIPASHKIYCPFKDCSELMVADYEGGGIVTSSECPRCHRLFCAQCKVSWHAGFDCKDFQKLKKNDDEELQERKLKELVQKELWQRCPRCSFYVEKRSGCNHMICRCGCQFCYLCGKEWSLEHSCIL